MIESYQDRMVVMGRKPDKPTLATVFDVSTSGIRIRIDGDPDPGQKYFKCNTTCKFDVGQRVYIVPDGSGYIVAFPVGNPMV